MYVHWGRMWRMAIHSTCSTHMAETTDLAWLKMPPHSGRLHLWQNTEDEMFATLQSAVKRLQSASLEICLQQLFKQNELRDHTPSQLLPFRWTMVGDAKLDDTIFHQFQMRCLPWNIATYRRHKWDKCDLEKLVNRPERNQGNDNWLPLFMLAHQQTRPPKFQDPGLHIHIFVRQGMIICITTGCRETLSACLIIESDAAGSGGALKTTPASKENEGAIEFQSPELGK